MVNIYDRAGKLKAQVHKTSKFLAHVFLYCLHSAGTNSLLSL